MQLKTHFDDLTLDDLLNSVLSELLRDSATVSASRGSFREIFGAMLILRNPRARLSRSESKGKLYSALGEFFWYLSGRNDLSFIKYYLPSSELDKESDDGVSIRSGTKFLTTDKDCTAEMGTNTRGGRDSILVARSGFLISQLSTKWGTPDSVLSFISPL